MNGHASMFASATDEALMNSLCQGDSGAMRELYQRYSKPMLYYFYRMLGQDEEKAQDFLQDLFLKVIEKPELFDASRRFKTWIYTVAHNMCKNEYRKMEVRKVMQRGQEMDVDNGERPDNDLHSKMFNEQLLRELDTLDEDRKTTFLLRYREGLSIKEISKVVQCNEGTVKSRLFYINKQLSERLQAWHPNNHKS